MLIFTRIWREIFTQIWRKINMNLYTNIKRDFYTNMKKKSPVRDGNNGGNRGRDKSGQICESGQRYRGKLSNFLREKHQSVWGWWDCWWNLWASVDLKVEHVTSTIFNWHLFKYSTSNDVHVGSNRDINGLLQVGRVQLDWTDLSNV